VFHPWLALDSDREARLWEKPGFNARTALPMGGLRQYDFSSSPRRFHSLYDFVMQLVFLGTGGFHPNERRHTAGVLLPELGLAFDAGTSAFRIAERMPQRDLQIFLTHAHLDHICGLTYLLVPLMENELLSCKVHGRMRVLDAVQRHLFAERVFPVLPRMEFVPLEESVALPDATITWTKLKHPGGSVGYRVDCADGSSLAYITDTYADGSYLDFIRGVDLLIHECYFSDDQWHWCEPTGHSHTSQVAKLAREARVGGLYLTHIDPRRPDDDPVGLDDARAIFPETYLAEDLLKIEW
jgi:ribonuclease Z